MDKNHPKIAWRVRLMATCMVAAFGCVVWRLWWVQVVDGAMYAERAGAGSEVRVRIPPVRGEIRDRNGVLLAENRSTYNVDFYLPEMVRAYKEQHGGDVPKVQYFSPVRGMLKTKEEPDIVRIVNTEVAPRLRHLGLPQNYDVRELQRHFRNDTEIPYTYVEGADFSTIAKFSENDIGLPGVNIVMKPVRHYVYGALAAHVLGYVGEPQSVENEPDVHDYDFYQPDQEGRAQLELSMDDYLRGTPGIRLMGRNVNGVIDRELRTDPPKQGDTVYLTIDARIQWITEAALRAVGRAGAVVVDPNNGEILAMASVPSFDPNQFIPSVSAADWKNLNDNKADPLVNRAISAFPPGSTFKIITSLAGLRRGLAKNAFTCSGGVSYGDHYFKCWNTHGHGRLTLSDAIKVSCNAFFYQYGNAAGIESIDTVGHLLGFGQPEEIGLDGEQPGILPGPEWLQAHSPSERWTSAYTANVSIGQGYDLVSPLQLVMAYSSLANGGISYQPSLVKKVTDAAGHPVLDAEGNPVAGVPRIRGRLADIGITPQNLEIARRGFWKVVNEDGGTGGRARLGNGIVAGKTGTAQAKLHGREDTIAWFVCFAPFDKPKYAVCVMVQGGEHGGSVAAPIAAQILQDIFAMDSGRYNPQLQPLPPAMQRDPFKTYLAVNFEKKAVGIAQADDQEPSGQAATLAMAARSDAGDVGAGRRSMTMVNGRVPVRKAEPVAEAPEHRGFFQRLFNIHRDQ